MLTGIIDLIIPVFFGKALKIGLHGIIKHCIEEEVF